MRKAVYCFIVSLFFLILSGFSHADKSLLFNDDFSARLKKWNMVDGKWKVKNEELICRGDGKIIAGQEKWKDYVFEAKIKTSKPGNKLWCVGALMFRFTKEGEFYFVMFHTNNKLELGKFKSKDHHALVVTKNKIADTKKWNDVRIEIKDADIKIYVNKEKILEYTDEEPLPEGSIGFYSLSSSLCQFDDVKVWEYKK